MSCPRCKSKLVSTKIGKLCMDCGCIVDPIEIQATLITPHEALVHAERRLKNPEEPGTGQVDDITDVTAFTAESNTSFGAFTWVQVAVSRFSYYAVVFVLVIIASGLSYSLFLNKPTETARRNCSSAISRTSSESASANGAIVPSPSPSCRP
jgi:hypothetical protein